MTGDPPADVEYSGVAANDDDDVYSQSDIDCRTGSRGVHLNKLPTLLGDSNAYHCNMISE